jgi:hypothetical protein
LSLHHHNSISCPAVSICLSSSLSVFHSISLSFIEQLFRKTNIRASREIERWREEERELAGIIIQLQGAEERGGRGRPNPTPSTLPSPSPPSPLPPTHQRDNSSVLAHSV